jgi:hypothetical protein
MKEDNKLDMIVRKEISKIENDAVEQMELVEYTRIFFEKNYKHIKWVYMDDPDVDTDEKMFLRVKSSMKQVIDLTKPNHTLHVNIADPIKLGILYDWIELIPSKNVSLNGYRGVLNNRGKEIVDGWNAYRSQP